MDYRSDQDLSILSREEITKNYVALRERYEELKLSEQRQLQELHQFRRELLTTQNDKNHLSSELEIVNSEHDKAIEAIEEKHRAEIQEYKDRLLLCKNELELVESARDNLESMVQDIQKEAAEEPSAVVPVESNQSFYVEKIAELEAENDVLAKAFDDIKVELTQAYESNLQFEKEIEDLKDRLLCLEENLQSKRDELEEKNEMYETAQERVIELSGELNGLRMESDTADKRGNSLFAEVDDQRQKMKALLTAQKANYIEMKTELEASQHEIRKLKRENAAMYKEMEVCSHMFLNAEQHHTEKLNERIAELMKENEAINRKLTSTERALSDMINKNDVKWLDPMMALCKNESNDLKDQLYRCSLQKVSIAETLRKCEEDSARWRFEALKSRCIIANRESLLEDNKIPFGAVSDIDKKARQIDRENVSPNIVCRPSMLGFKRRSITRTQSPQTSSTEEKIVEAVPKSEPLSPDPIDIKNSETEKESNGTLQTASEPTSTVDRTELAEPKEVKEQFVQQSKAFSGVTIRKKMNSSNTSFLDLSVGHQRSPGTVRLATIIRPKNNHQSNSTGILKQSNSPNIQTDKKVKFDDGTSAVSKIKKEPSTQLKSEKVDSAPKTAIKKRIFISSSKKPTAK